MIDIRVRDIGKMLPPDWSVEVDEDGAIWVQSPDVLDAADAISIAQQIVRELEQPLTLRYYIKLADKAALALAQETATSYGLVLVPVGDDVFHVVTKAAFDGGEKAPGKAKKVKFRPAAKPVVEEPAPVVEEAPELPADEVAATDDDQ